MNKSFAIIGPIDSQNTTDLYDEIISCNNTCKIYGIQDISLDISNVFINPFFKHDIYIFRGYNKSLNFAQSIATLLHQKNKIVIDRTLYKSNIKDKLQESILLNQNKIPQPKTYYAHSLKSWRKLLKNITFPIIIKPIDGQQGQNIHLFSTITNTLDFLKSNNEPFLAQQYIKSDGDIRIFIINNEIIGAIKRFTIKDDFRSNASLGAKTVPFKLSKNTINISLKAHKCIGYDISGVDIIFDKDNNPFVLEVNHTPQWQAFKKTTSNNPAKQIINFALQQYEKKDRVL
jgi:ribosomal protein S6--L-glutamate ligase